MLLHVSRSLDPKHPNGENSLDEQSRRRRHFPWREGLALRLPTPRIISVPARFNKPPSKPNRGTVVPEITRFAPGIKPVNLGVR